VNIDNITDQAKQVQHDNDCAKPWRICGCVVAILLRNADLRLAMEQAKSNPAPEVIAEKRAADIEAMPEHLKTPPLLPESAIPEDLQRKRRIYLENAGISLVRKRLLALSPQAQFDKIHELDRVTKDEAYLTIRKSKGAVQDSINALRAILQGMNREENEIRARENSIEKMLQERKDKVYKPKEVNPVADATKARQKKDVKAQLGSMGIDLSKLLSGFNAERALENIKASNAAIEADKKKDETK
jgi:hypothetical protein